MDMHLNVGSIFPIIRGSHPAGLERLKDKVVEPAVKLAVSIQTSTSMYDTMTAIGASVIPVSHRPKAIHKAVLGQWRIIDVATGKHLKSDSPVTVDENGMMGDLLLVVSPGLERRSGERSIALVQGTLLVDLYVPLGRRDAAPKKRDCSVLTQ